MKNLRIMTSVTSLNDGKNHKYFKYLVSLVDSGDTIYWNLLNVLFDTPFIGWLPNDENRVREGLDLRAIFLEKYDIPYALVADKDECTILEMLIALALRIDVHVTDFSKKPRTDYWFWTIIKNLELDNYTDDYLMGAVEEAEVRELLRVVVDRQYESNGYGGLFPLLKSHADQTKVEIWYQLQSWLSENFEF